MSSVYLGVDGGQSTTTVLFADETGRIIGHGRGGPCNHVTGPEAQSKFNAAVGSALHEAGLQSCFDPRVQSFDAACFGFSGGFEDKEPLARALVTADQYEFTHDADIALTGATAGESGVIVIAGTGSMAFGRNAANRTARAGGWGYLFGDEGGAFDLVRRALRAALRFEEGWGPPTALHAALLEATQAPDANTLLHRWYAEPRSQIAALAPLVTDTANNADPVALEILHDAGRDLAHYAAAVHSNLFTPADSLQLSYAGAVFRSTPLLDSFTSRAHTLTGLTAHPPRFTPAAGALIRALRLDGLQCELSGVPASDK